MPSVEAVVEVLVNVAIDEGRSPLQRTDCGRMALKEKDCGGRRLGEVCRPLLKQLLRQLVRKERPLTMGHTLLRTQ